MADLDQHPRSQHGRAQITFRLAGLKPTLVPLLFLRAAAGPAGLLLVIVEVLNAAIHHLHGGIAQEVHDDVVRQQAARVRPLPVPRHLTDLAPRPVVGGAPLSRRRLALVTALGLVTVLVVPSLGQALGLVLEPRVPASVVAGRSAGPAAAILDAVVRRRPLAVVAAAAAGGAAAVVVVFLGVPRVPTAYLLERLPVPRVPLLTLSLVLWGAPRLVGAEVFRWGPSGG
jgi:hypothetical protein